MSTKAYDQKILILDFGSQYTQLIARRIREARVYCEIYPFNVDIQKVRLFNPKGIILSGGPYSIYEDGAPMCNPEIIALGIPLLGISYGMQCITHVLGGIVSKVSTRREYGSAEISLIEPDSGLFRGFSNNNPHRVWMDNGDRVEQIPEGFVTIAKSDNSPVAMANYEKCIFGLQFHPEVVNTVNGLEIIKNFLFLICGCEPTWTMASFVTQVVSEVRKSVGNSKVLCALSGGVDSSVTAVLLHKAIGDKLICVFVDHGLNRKNEPKMVEETFKKHYGMNFHKVDAAEIFLSRLAGVTDPERKRKIIGNTFIDVFEKKAKEFGDIEFLAQGTIYPDVIESIPFKGQSIAIKSHHNVGGLPEKMNLKLVEPLKELFKDEVREAGLELGIPREMVMRQPFPGPGLAVRILGEVTEERLNILREADEIVRDEIIKAGLHEKIWQYFAVLLPIKTVGVMGDKRTYENVIAVRCVDSMNAMTADWSKIPYDVLATISTKIIHLVSGVNRVVYDISNKPPSTIEWE